ncbi:TolC family outer membrane protein [Parapedomonas caeni]
MTIRRLILLTTVAAALTGGTAGAETLEEALGLAYSSNPDLAAQRAALRAVDEDVASAVSGYRPDIGVTSAITRTDVDDGTDAATTKSVSGQLSQSLFSGLRTVNSVKAADAAVLAGRESLRFSEISVLRDAVAAYMDVVRDEEVLRLNQNNVEVLQRQLQASRDRFEVGELTRTDVAQSEARLSSAVSARIAAEGNLTASREAYRRVIGQAPGTLGKPGQLPALPATVDEAIEVALKESPVALAARYTEQAAGHNVAVAKGAVLPSLSANLGLSYRKNDTTAAVTTIDDDRVTSTVGLTLTVPLYQAGAEYASVRRAQQVRSQRMLEIASAERQVVEGVRNAWEGLRTARSTITSARSAVTANEIALEGVKQEQEVGSRTILEVLNAEQELLVARSELVTAERNEVVAAYALLGAIGRLGARELALSVDIYDPAEHYKKSKWRLFGWEGQN